jgi:hypothetical protein
MVVPSNDPDIPSGTVTASGEGGIATADNNTKHGG